MLLAPFAPHFTSELWQQLGRLDSVHCDHWPRLDEKYLIGETIIIPIQVNGKLRGRLEIAPDILKEEVLRLAKEQESVARFAQNDDGGLFYLSWAAVFLQFFLALWSLKVLTIIVRFCILMILNVQYNNQKDCEQMNHIRRRLWSN